MTHLPFVARAALLAVAAVLAGFSVPSVSAALASPNVLIIVTDDQRAGTLGVMPRTTRFFQDRGRTFPNGFVTTPLCCPSRSSIFTGLYAHNHGVLGNGQHSLPQSVTLQRYLHDAGYETAIVGKYLNSWPLDQDPPHFDHWAVGEANTYRDPQFNVDGSVRRLPGYSTDIVASNAVHLLRGFEVTDKRPWFLYVAPVAPHLPSTPPPKYARVSVSGWNKDPSMLESDTRDKPPWVQASISSDRWIRAKRADQLRTLMSVDDLVGRIARTLGALRERRNTIAFFLSDNGFLWGEHGLTRKEQPYTPSIKVPFLFRWPGHVAPGSRDGRYATNVDIAPTVLDAAGLIAPSPMDGRSLLRKWTRGHLFTEFFRPGDPGGIPGWASIRTKRLQYVEYYDAERTRVIFREYYRLDRDPYQLTNVLRDGNPANDPDLTDLHRLLERDRTCAASTCPPSMTAATQINNVPPQHITRSPERKLTRSVSTQVFRQRIVSTSGVPHGDIADYRRSPYWRPGMPTGMNKAWREFLQAEVADITNGANVVLHQGDQVEGRWGRDCDGRGVFGPVGTQDERTRALTLAGNIYYSDIKRFWAGHDVLFGMGDHEIGDIGPSGIVLPGTFTYQAHRYWNRVWHRQYGPSRYASRRGDVGIITLDPIKKNSTGIVAKISHSDLDWMQNKIAAWKTKGVTWFLVQSEIPAIGPNRAHGTSGLLLRNGDEVWRRFASMGVDIFLAAEFHADTTHTRDGMTPVQVVHGGRHLRASWLVIDEYEDHLQLTLMSSHGKHVGDEEIWATSCKERLPRHPLPGTPTVIGTMTIHADGTTSDRTGSLQEGIS